MPINWPAPIPIRSLPIRRAQVEALREIAEQLHIKNTLKKIELSENHENVYYDKESGILSINEKEEEEEEEQPKKQPKTLLVTLSPGSQDDLDMWHTNKGNLKGSKLSAIEEDVFKAYEAMLKEHDEYMKNSEIVSFPTRRGKVEFRVRKKQEGKA